MSKLSKLFLLWSLLILAVGQAHAFPGKNASSDAAAAAPAASGSSGTVVETMNSGGYTYVLIDNAGNRSWAAMPETAVKVGEEVTLAPGAPMNNFNSRTLNRTFDTIYFTSGVVGR